MKGITVKFMSEVTPQKTKIKNIFFIKLWQTNDAPGNSLCSSILNHFPHSARICNQVSSRSYQFFWSEKVFCGFNILLQYLLSHNNFLPAKIIQQELHVFMKQYLKVTCYNDDFSFSITLLPTCENTDFYYSWKTVRSHLVSEITPVDGTIHTH